MDRIGFIGLGNMGRPMASNLQRKGFALTVFDVSPVAMAELSQNGAAVATRSADVAAASNVVITMLPDSAAVEQVVLGAEGLLGHLRPGGLVMDMSTVDPMLTDRLAAAAAAKGCAFV